MIQATRLFGEFMEAQIHKNAMKYEFLRSVRLTWSLLIIKTFLLRFHVLAVKLSQWFPREIFSLFIAFSFQTWKLRWFISRGNCSLLSCGVLNKILFFIQHVIKYIYWFVPWTFAFIQKDARITKTFRGSFDPEYVCLLILNCFRLETWDPLEIIYLLCFLRQML